MVKGSAWTVGVRWAARGLGLVSTIFLARLLLPKDFGIVTIAMIVVGTVEIFNQTGQHLAIIRHPSPTRAHYDSAWTIFIILSSILGAAVFLAAPLTNIYFHEPRAIPVVRILALKTFLSGFENIGIVDFRRDLQFHRQFLYQFLPSFLSFFITLAAAFILRNYWALVIGILSQQFASILLSYVLSPFRPRLSLAKVRELWSFSIWTFVRSIGTYLSSQIDKLAIGSFAGAAAMGRYEIAVDVSSSPSQEINYPMISVLFPVMVKAQGDRIKLKELYLTVLYWSVLICTSTGVGVAMVASDMVDVVLGPNWTDVKPLMPWLAMGYAMIGFAASAFPAFDTVGKPHIAARLQWIFVALFVCCAAPVMLVFKTLQAMVEARFVLALVMVPIIFGTLAREYDLRRRDFVFVFWRPLMASAVMAGLVFAIQRVMPGGALRLIATVLAGAAGYTATIFSVWYLIGSPDGPEKTVWHLLQRMIGKTQEKEVFPHDLELGEGLLHRPVSLPPPVRAEN